MLLLGLISGVFAGLIIFGFSDIIIASQNNFSVQATNYMKFIFGVYLIYLPFKAVSGIMASGVINTGGQAKKSLIGDLIFTWGINITMLLIGTFVLNWSPYVILILICTDEIMKAPYFYAIYKKGSWLQNLTREEKS